MTEREREAEMEDMEEGRDLNELNTDQTGKTKYITHAGKKWKVSYQKLGWYQKKEAISQATSIDRGNRVYFDLAKYTRLCLIKMKVAINDHVLDEIDYLKLDENVGRQLDELVESPAEIISEKEADFTGASSGGA